MHNDTEMQVGLAVGDINDVRMEAELKKLKLQVWILVYYSGMSEQISDN